MASKYHNKITVFEGNKFHSIGEARRYKELLLLQKAQKIFNLKLQVKYPLMVEGEKVGTYIADFVYYEDDNLVIEDFKGVLTAVFKLKWKILQAMHKNTIGMIFRITT